MSKRHPKLVAYESLLRQTTRLRVVGLQWMGDPPGDKVWGEVAGAALPAAIALLAAREWTREDLKDEADEALCECEPVCFYELYEGPRRLAVIQFHGVGHMTLRGATGIYDLAQGDAIEDWLAARGITDRQLGQG